MIFNILCIMSTDEWTVSDVVGRIYKSGSLTSIGYYNYVEIFHQFRQHRVKTIKIETSEHHKVLFMILFDVGKNEYSTNISQIEVLFGKKPLWLNLLFINRPYLFVLCNLFGLILTTC